MAQLVLGVPGLLRECIGGDESVLLQASTLGQAIEGMIATYPRLKVHVFDETGDLREHVFLALNGRKLAVSQLALPLEDGDRLDVVQAVSGG